MQTDTLSVITVAPMEAAERETALAMLAENNLPVAGLAEHWGTALAARADGRLVGMVALELYVDGALLRSLVVDSAYRGQHIGELLVEAAVSLACDLQMPGVYLLTETARGYFPRFCFQVVSREEIPQGVRQSVEFTSVCPASATAMYLPLRKEEAL